MDPLCENLISCPYCGENIHILLDISEANQAVTEDCSVCCRPIVLHIYQVDSGGELQVTALSEDEAY